MSLNWKEIDTIISEWNFIGGKVQQVLQPTLQTLFFEIYTKPQPTNANAQHCQQPKTQSLAFLFVSFKNKEVNIHQASRRARKPKTAQRFQQLLQARLIGATIMDIEHINHDRIIKITFEKKQHDKINDDDNATLQHCKKPATTIFFLYLKLWNNQANGMLCNEDNSIIDLVYRRPKQQLMPSEKFIFPKKTAHTKIINMREWDKELFTSFNAYIENNYTNAAKEYGEKNKTLSLQRALEKQLHAHTQSLSKIHTQLQTYRDTIGIESYGNIILANIQNISKEQMTLECEEDNEILIIPLSSTLTPVENAERYFNQAKKASRSLTILEKQNQNIQNTIAQLENIKNQFAENNFQISETEMSILFPKISHSKANTTTQSLTTKQDSIKIILQDGDMIIMVGRNARENELLLRRYVKGNDMWMHVRGNSGAFVFIKSQRKQQKTIPLETLIQCGQLAALYSKAKNESYADIYYTEVKYLKRIKHSIGLVTPIRSKNLQIKIDTQAAKNYLNEHLR